MKLSPRVTSTENWHAGYRPLLPAALPNLVHEPTRYNECHSQNVLWGINIRTEFAAEHTANERRQRIPHGAEQQRRGTEE